MRMVIITGHSGSGKSTAVKALEDEGFYCIDNLPVDLFTTFVELVEKSREHVTGIALVMDIRGRDFIKGYERIVQELGSSHPMEVIFLDASDEVLTRRFSETRRPHPAAPGGSVADGIRAEREELAGLHRLATLVIDTSELNVHQLRQLILDHVRGGATPRPMTVRLQSFGYRFGIPLESDLVIDVRFLPNPHFIPELKPMSGLDEPIREYVMERQETKEFLRRFTSLLEFLLAGYRTEGKSYLTISIGCTGGRHRSVVIAEELQKFFTDKQVTLNVSHRDINKG